MIAVFMAGGGQGKRDATQSNVIPSFLFLFLLSLSSGTVGGVPSEARSLTRGKIKNKEERFRLVTSL
jgi:hypothetical protein